MTQEINDSFYGRFVERSPDDFCPSCSAKRATLWTKFVW